MFIFTLTFVLIDKFPRVRFILQKILYQIIQYMPPEFLAVGLDHRCLVRPLHQEFTASLVIYESRTEWRK